MIHNVIDMTVEGSVGTPTLTTYIIDDAEMFLIRKRPLIIICPGGGYNHLSDREGELLALQYLSMGFHAAVLRYSVTPAVYPTPLLELAKAMATVRKHTEEWHIEENKILVQGSSAGGHLAGLLGCYWNKEWLADQIAEGDTQLLKPNGLVLSYPVITSGEFAHRGSFDMLIGEGANAQRRESLLEELSLEKQVTEDTPPTFIWHTYEDGAVPAENSLLFVQALRRKNIPVEFHLYPRGGHGLGLGTELTCSSSGKEIRPEINTWIHMAETFIRNL